jgi:hypothetical protein
LLFLCDELLKWESSESENENLLRIYNNLLLSEKT